MKMDTRTAACQECKRPSIVLFEPDTYNLPTEMFAKRLVNSPVEFGTVSLQVEADEEETDDGAGRTMWGYDIDVAMHPHRGALVCSAVGAKAGALEDELEVIVDSVRRERDVLLEALADAHDLRDETPPLGAFVVLMNAEESDVPDRLAGDDVWFCPASRIDALAEEAVKAMDRFGEDAERPFYEYGPRFVATVRSLSPAHASYRSALEALALFGSI